MIERTRKLREGNPQDIDCIDMLLLPLRTAKGLVK